MGHVAGLLFQSINNAEVSVGEFICRMAVLLLYNSLPFRHKQGKRAAWPFVHLGCVQPFVSDKSTNHSFAALNLSWI